MAERRLITGCGRSGTKYIAAVMQGLGLDVAHEELKSQGIADWTFASDMGANFHDGIVNYHGKLVVQNTFDTILHQVRDPMSVMCSVSTFGEDTWEYVYNNSPVDKGEHLIVRAAQYWYYWNLQAQRIAHWTYRVETLRKVFPVFCEKLNVDCNYDVLDTVPTTVNARSRKGDKYNERYKTFSWNDLYQLNPQLYDKVAALALSYGYDEIDIWI